MHVQTRRRTACCHCPDLTRSGPGGRKETERNPGDRSQHGEADSVEELAYGKVSQGPPQRGVCTKVGVQEASRAGLLEEVSSAAPSTNVAVRTIVPTSPHPPNTGMNPAL